VYFPYAAVVCIITFAARRNTSKQHSPDPDCRAQRCAASAALSIAAAGALSAAAAAAAATAAATLLTSLLQTTCVVLGSLCSSAAEVLLNLHMFKSYASKSAYVCYHMPLC
jgi:hypothetical protein